MWSWCFSVARGGHLQAVLVILTGYLDVYTAQTTKVYGYVHQLTSECRSAGLANIAQVGWQAVLYVIIYEEEIMLSGKSWWQASHYV